MIALESMIIVVRSVEERTSNASAHLLRELFPNTVVHVLNLTPFSVAIREMFQIGIRSGAKWLLVIDADVLVAEAGLREWLRKAYESDDHIFQIQGLIVDKFFSVYRPAGNHLYRTKFMPKAIELIPQEGKSLRPETDMLNEMAIRGFPWVQCDAVIGIHDFEQYYADIFRKCFLQAHKHGHLSKDLKELWSSRLDTDLDFKVSTLGLTQGELFSDTVFVDKRFMKGESLKVLEANEIVEKESQLKLDAISDFVDSIVEGYSSPEKRLLQEKIFPKNLWNRVVDRQSVTSQKKGLKNGIFEWLGLVFKRLSITQNS